MFKSNELKLNVKWRATRIVLAVGQASAAGHIYTTVSAVNVSLKVNVLHI